jgi:hypothetical protein
MTFVPSAVTWTRTLWSTPLALRTATSSGGFTNDVTVINPDTNTVADTIQLSTPSNTLLGTVAVSPTGPAAGDVYVTTIGDTRISDVQVINPATDTVTIPYGSAVPTGDSVAATGLTISPTGPYAGDVFVGNPSYGSPGAVYVINPATNTVVDTINLGNVAGIAGFPVDALWMAVSPTGPYVGDVYASTGDLYVIKP